MTLAIGQSWTGVALGDWTNQSAPTDSRGSRVQVIDFDAVHSGFRLTAYPDDVAPKTPNSNPRAQLVSPKLMVDGGEYRLSGGRMRIVDLAQPLAKISDPWVEFIQFAYGAPFAGSPAHRLITRDGKTWGVRRADAALALSMPLVLGEWWNIEAGWKLSRDPSKGWFWFSAWRDNEPAWKYLMPARQEATIIDSMSTGPWALYLDSYMHVGSSPRAVADFVVPTLTRTA